MVALIVKPASKESEQSLQTQPNTAVATSSPLPICDVENVVKLDSTGCKTNFTVTGNFAGIRYFAEYLDGDSIYKARFLGPSGIGFHYDGSMIIADQIRMRGVQNRMAFTRPYLNSGLSLKQFSLDSNGTIYVPVPGRYIVAVNSNTSVETIIAGDNSSSGFLDNSDPLKAKFANPLQTVSHQKKLYILDGISPNSAAIRVIDFCPHTLNPGVRTMLSSSATSGHSLG